MIDFNDKRYYTPYELLDFINDDSTVISKAWNKRFPKCKDVILFEQIRRVLQAARNDKKIDFIKFKKTLNSEKLYYGFAIEDVIDYLEL